MQTGTQLQAPEGFEILSKGVAYHLLRSDSARERVLLLEFKKIPTAPNAPTKTAGRKRGAAFGFRPVLHFLSRYSFERGLEDGLIVFCDEQHELPPWFSGISIDQLRFHADPSKNRKKSHEERIDRTLMHLWPLVQNLELVLAAEFPDALINAHARMCSPKQNETRLRTAFYAYVCYGFSRWALHYAVHLIGQWKRTGRDRKFGRPSRKHGANHGYSATDPGMVQQMLEGYRKFAGPGQHLSRIYRRTLTSVFGCVVQTDPTGRKSFVHPAGRPFPSIGQFSYRIAQEFPLEMRQVYKYGHARVRNRLTHSQGRFAESVGSLMERTEQDAYYCNQVARGYLPGSHLPPLWVVRIRCIASGMLVGIGFSVGSETAAAYRMALFCTAIGKVKFCSLFGIDIKPDDWPSIGISPHIINDRGPGSTAKADSSDPALRPTIKEAAPSYSGQSKASVETTHPKQVKKEGKPFYQETSLTIPQIATQEILRTIADNHSIDVSDRLNNDALKKSVFPTPASLWQYLDRKGRNHAITPIFEEAVRAYLTLVEVSVRDDAVYYKDARYGSDGLNDSGILQKAHNIGRYKLKAYMLDACVRHLWLDLGTQLIEIDAMLSLRDGQEQLYLSVVEIEQLSQIRSDGKLELKSHRNAAKSEYESKFEGQTGKPFEQGVDKPGRSRRTKAASVHERQEIIDYLRAGRGSR